MTFFSRSERVCSTESSCSWSRMKLAASTGTTASESSMKSPRWESSSSPIGVSRLTGSWLTLRISRTFSGENSISRPISSGVGSRPRSCRSWRWMRISLLIVSTMCTGMRMVRAWSAMALVIAWRIHQVEEQHAAAHVALGDRDDQAEVGLDQLLLGELAVALDPLQLAQAGGAELLGLGGGLVELGGGRLALLDRLGEDDLLLRGQERHLADLLEVHADGVVGGSLEGQVVVAGRARLAGELLGVQLVHHLDDFDVLVGEHLVDVVDLLCGQIDRSERLDHLFSGDEAAFLALDDEIPHLVELGFLGHGHRVSVPLV